MTETANPDAPANGAAKPPRKAGGGLLRSSAIYSGLTLVSRFVGFARDLVITARLGASQTIAANARSPRATGGHRTPVAATIAGRSEATPTAMSSGPPGR